MAQLDSLGIIRMDIPSKIPPVIEYVAPKQRHFLSPVPAPTFLAWLTWFTFGLALLSTTISMLIPFGIAFTFLGIAPFLRERLVLRFLPLFIGLLGVSLLAIIQALRVGDGFPTSIPKPPIWYVGALVVGWGIGILFGFRLWRASRVKGSHDA